eukprot:2745927-Pyramimonas_sp.AAC.1
MYSYVLSDYFKSADLAKRWSAALSQFEVGRARVHGRSKTSSGRKPKKRLLGSRAQASKKPVRAYDIYVSERYCEVGGEGSMVQKRRKVDDMWRELSDGERA